MSWLPKADREAKRGFSLIEIVVGTVVFSIIMTAAFGLIVTYSRVSARGEAITTEFNFGRTAITKLNEDVRSARYIYHYTRVTFDSNIRVDKIAVQQGLAGLAIDYPIVTAGAFIGGPPAGYSSTEGIGFLVKDSLTLMTGSLATPSYVCWLRHPGPANPKSPTETENAYKAIWYRFIRMEMKCGEFKATSTQGKWLDMSQKWSTFGASDASRSTLLFVDSAKSVGDQTCQPTTVNAYGHVANSDVFRWENPHPYSAEGPMSPYWITTSLYMGDPFNNQLRTGAKGGVLFADPDWYVQSVHLTSQAYAQNVSMPGAL